MKAIEGGHGVGPDAVRQDDLVLSRLLPWALPAPSDCQSPDPIAPVFVRRTAGEHAAISLGLVKEDPKLRPW